MWKVYDDGCIYFYIFINEVIIFKKRVWFDNKCLGFVIVLFFDKEYFVE